MTQPLDIITMALQAIGAVAPGDTVPPELTTQAFNMLNMMLDQASNDDFMVFSTQETSQVFSNPGINVTIGIGGQINVVRPLTIQSAFARVSGIDYPIRVMNVEQYELIGLKSLNGPWPTALYYNSGSPIGTISLWPNPATFELHLFYSQLFTQFATINDSIVFPPGYVMWMTWALAKLLLPFYGKASNQGLVAIVSENAASAMGAIKGTNMQPQQVVQFDRALYGGTCQDAGWIMNGGFS